VERTTGGGKGEKKGVSTMSTTPYAPFFTPSFTIPIRPPHPGKRSQRNPARPQMLGRDHVPMEDMPSFDVRYRGVLLQFWCHGRRAGRAMAHASGADLPLGRPGCRLPQPTCRRTLLVPVRRLDLSRVPDRFWRCASFDF